MEPNEPYTGPDETEPDAERSAEDLREDALPEGPAFGPDAPDPEIEENEGIGGMALHAAGRLLFFVLMVVLFLGLLLGGVCFWMYRSTTEERVPTVSFRFSGQELEPVGSDWTVPVIGPITRSFSHGENTSAGSSSFQQLDTVTEVSPDLSLSDNFQLALTIRDEAGNTVFEGDKEAFAKFAFEADGNYTAEAEVSRTVSSSLFGRNDYAFRFKLSVDPEISVSRESVSQGSAFTVVLKGSLGEVAPQLQAEFSPKSTFVQFDKNWIACVDVPIDTPSGDYALKVISGEHELTQNVHVYGRVVRETDTSTLDGTSSVPYIGALPDALEEYMGISDPDIYWQHGFIQPVKGTLLRDYYVNEYTDRIKDPILIALVPDLVEAYNAGIEPRLSMNVTYSLPAGTEVDAPADGRVIFCGNVNGGGKTLVIEHGDGLKSIFYLLGSVKCEEGDYVVQGDKIASSNDHIICEMRLNGTSISPWDVWRNMGGLKTE